MASRRASVTCTSRSLMAYCRAGDSVFSSVASWSGALDFPLPLADFAPAPSGSASPSARIARARARAGLFVVLVHIRPVLALERPILLVVAHQALQGQLGEHVGRVAPVAQVGD